MHKSSCRHEQPIPSLDLLPMLWLMDHIRCAVCLTKSTKKDVAQSMHDAGEIESVALAVESCPLVRSGNISSTGWRLKERKAE